MISLLTITQEQLNNFRSALAEQFRFKVAKRLRCLFHTELSAVSEAKLLDYVEQRVEDAGHYGIQSSVALHRYIEISAFLDWYAIDLGLSVETLLRKVSTHTATTEIDLLDLVEGELATRLGCQSLMV